MPNQINAEAKDVQETLRENGFENHAAVAQLMTDYMECGGLAPSQARTLALRRVRTEGMTYESLASASGISRGAFDKTSSDAKREVRESRILSRLVREDFPVRFVGQFKQSIGTDSFPDVEYLDVLIGEYLPLGSYGDTPNLKYVVYTDLYEAAGEQEFPDSDGVGSRHLFSGTSVERYADAEALVEDQYHETEFTNMNRDWGMYWNLRECGFDFESNLYRLLSQGDSVRFVGDPGNDGVLDRLSGEVGEVVELEGDERVRVRFDVEETDSGENVEILTMAHSLELP